MSGRPTTHARRETLRGKAALAESNLRLRRLFQTMAEGVVLFGPKGEVLHANHAAERMAGIKWSELDRYDSRLPPFEPLRADGSPLPVAERPTWRAAKEKRRVSARNIGIRRRDGSLIWIDITAAPLRSRNRKPAGLVVTFADVTGRYLSERALQESEARYRMLVENTPAVTYVAALGARSSILYVSPRIKALLGYSPAACTGDPGCWLKSLHPGDRARVLKEAAWARRRNRPFVSEYRMVDRHGRTVWVHDEGVVVRDRQNRPVCMQGVMFDVTQHKAADQALAESERNFHALTDMAREAILVEDARHRLVYANPHAAALTGHTVDELTGMPAARLLPTRERPRVRLHTGRHLAGEVSSRPYETVLVRRDGQEISVEVCAARVVWQGQPATLGMIRDIGERKKAEEGLRQSEALYRTTIDALSEGVHVLDTDLRIILFNRHFEEWCRRLGILGARVGAHLHEAFPFLPARVADEYRRVIATGQPCAMTETTRLQDRDVVTETLKIPIREGRRVVKVLTIVRDVTERRRLEKEILDVGRREQQRIGQALHDSLGQELAGMAFLAKALQSNLAAKALREAKDVARIGILIKGALSQTRSIARGLSPVDVAGEGLGVALRQTAEQIRRTHGVCCRCEIGGTGVIDDNEMATHLYYIAREAVTNAVRHARPKHILIKLFVGRSRGRLAVHDDGRGLPASAAGRQGMGFDIMRYRAEMIGGRLRIDGAGRGVMVTCTFDHKRPGRSARAAAPI